MVLAQGLMRLERNEAPPFEGICFTPPWFLHRLPLGATNILLLLERLCTTLLPLFERSSDVLEP